MYPPEASGREPAAHGPAPDKLPPVHNRLLSSPPPRLHSFSSSGHIHSSPSRARRYVQLPAYVALLPASFFLSLAKPARTKGNHRRCNDLYYVDNMIIILHFFHRTRYLGLSLGLGCVSTRNTDDRRGEGRKKIAERVRTKLKKGIVGGKRKLAVGPQQNKEGEP